MYSDDFSTGGGAEVKREAVETSAVPIPQRRAPELTDLRDLDLELSQDAQDLYVAMAGKLGYDPGVPGDRFQMDDEDIFQVDEADLIHGPTLAELNANPDTLLDVDIDFDDLLLPAERSTMLVHPQSIQPHLLQSVESAPSSPYDVYGRSQTAFSPSSQHSSASSSLLQPYGGPTLHELTACVDPVSNSDVLLGQSMPPQLRLPTLAHQLSSSAPTHSHLTRDQIWQRREPRQHLISTSSIAELGSISSLSGGLLSPGAELSQEEEEHNSDSDSERYEDFSSDDSDNEDAKHRSNTRKERYFWQYNVQAKGPKGQRLVLKAKLHDPHVLNTVTDPVFSPDCSVRGIKHSGKARKGDGNDLTPNPRKLFAIGKELDGLGRIINDMTPVSELPINVRPKTRKEKNKLASRACRLKKKAQHEANKLKLYGLEREHKRLLNGIEQLKAVVCTRVANPQPDVDYKAHVDGIIKYATEFKIAGHTSEFVNTVLDKVRAGQTNGGLTDI